MSSSLTSVPSQTASTSNRSDVLDSTPLGSFYIAGIGLWGPSFDSLDSYLDVAKEFQQDADPNIELAAPVKPVPKLIPANERRRAPLAVKAAVSVCEQALAMSGLSSNELACVFGSSMGDTDLTDYMCRVLAQDPALLSPTKFHNSVHNAAAGYWTIASDCQQAANSVAAQEFTAGMSLFEAASQARYEEQPVMLALFDTAVSSSYRSLYDLADSFACALVLIPECDSLRELTKSLDQNHSENLKSISKSIDISVQNSAASDSRFSKKKILSNLSAEILPLVNFLYLDSKVDNFSDATDYSELMLALSDQSYLCIRKTKTADSVYTEAR